MHPSSVPLLFDSQTLPLQGFNGLRMMWKRQWCWNSLLFFTVKLEGCTYLMRLIKSCSFIKMLLTSWKKNAIFSASPIFISTLWVILFFLAFL
jgi:hypothetical protein